MSMRKHSSKNSMIFKNRSESTLEDENYIIMGGCRDSIHYFTKDSISKLREIYPDIGAKYLVTISDS